MALRKFSAPRIEPPKPIVIAAPKPKVKEFKCFVCGATIVNLQDNCVSGIARGSILRFRPELEPGQAIYRCSDCGPGSQQWEDSGIGGEIHSMMRRVKTEVKYDDEGKVIVKPKRSRPVKTPLEKALMSAVGRIRYFIYMDNQYDESGPHTEKRPLWTIRTPNFTVKRNGNVCAVTLPDGKIETIAVGKVVEHLTKLVHRAVGISEAMNMEVIISGKDPVKEAPTPAPVVVNVAPIQRTPGLRLGKHKLS